MRRHLTSISWRSFSPITSILTQVDLLWVTVGLVCFGDTQNSIWGTLWDVGEDAGASNRLGVRLGRLLRKSARAERAARYRGKHVGGCVIDEEETITEDTQHRIEFGMNQKECGKSDTVTK